MDSIKYREVLLQESDFNPLAKQADGNEDDEYILQKKEEVIIDDTGKITNVTTTTISAETTTPEKQKGGWWSKVKSKIVSETTQRAFTDVYDVCKELVKDLNYNPIDIAMSMAVMSTYRKVEKANSGILVNDLTLVEKVNHFMRFAAATYGWKLSYGYQFKKSTKGVIEGLKLNDALNKKILVEHTGIKYEDVIMERWTTGEKFAPGHYIIVDHSSKSIILAIRGTFHFRDALTDLVARYEPYKGGFVHYGMLLAAKEIAQTSVPILLEQFKKYSDYGLVITGHSLGAGTATLLTIMLYDEYNFSSIHCYAYAPPCVLSLDLANRCRDLVTSVVVNEDVVPRLSYGSVEDMKKVLKHLLDQKNGKAQRLFQVMSAGNNLGTSLTQKLSNYLGDAKPDLNYVVPNPGERLYPPGSVYHILASSNVYGSKYDVMEESTPSYFFDIILSNKMFTDHFPDVYESALLEVQKKLLKEAQNRPSSDLSEQDRKAIEEMSHQPQESIAATVERALEGTVVEGLQGSI